MLFTLLGENHTKHINTHCPVHAQYLPVHCLGSERGVPGEGWGRVDGPVLVVDVEDLLQVWTGKEVWGGKA